jgi:hypothetical protein
VGRDFDIVTPSQGQAQQKGHHPMRRTTLQRTTAAAVTASVLVLAGCAPQDDGTPPGSGAPSPSPATAAPGCTARTRLTAADTGRLVRLAEGVRICLTLDGTEDRPWTPVTTTGTSLEAADPGVFVPPGDAVAAFTALAPGTAHLTSSRPLCAARPGRATCQGIQEWTVTVTVTAP